MLTKRTTLSTSYLQNASLYLGYSIAFRNTKMFFNLIGNRTFIDLHNIHHTKSQLSKLSSLVNSVFSGNNLIWIVKPGAISIKLSLLYTLSAFQKKLIKSFLNIWTDKWVPGFLTNKESFIDVKNSIQHPSFLLYTSHTNSRQLLADGWNTGILQGGFADSNSDRISYSYLIPANEKSVKASEFFCMFCIGLALPAGLRKRASFLKWDKK